MAIHVNETVLACWLPMLNWLKEIGTAQLLASVPTLFAALDVQVIL
jgi:hypothetical protein